MKKLDMANKMYEQNSDGGKGASPKFKMRGEGEGAASKVKQASAGVGSSPKSVQANVGGSFKAKYAGMAKKMAQKMINGSSKADQKGKGSLRSTGDNMGETMMLGKDGNNRA